MPFSIYVVRMGRGELRTGFRLGNLKERVYLEEEVIDERIILKRENRALLGYYAASIVIIDVSG